MFFVESKVLVVEVVDVVEVVVVVVVDVVLVVVFYRIKIKIKLIKFLNQIFIHGFMT